jgi:hypothetical protein
MRTNKIIAITAGAFICMAAIITSCSKDKVVTQSNESESGKAKSALASTVDLQNYQTRFVKNADGTQSIFFAEPEDIVVYSEKAKQLGYNALTLAKGVYEIKVDKRGHSTLDLNILTAEGRGSEQPVPMGIRIAKRHKTSCGTTYGNFDCKCGIGFNCGFVSFSPATDQDALMSASSNGATGSVHLDFQQNNMNWVAIEN